MPHPSSGKFSDITSIGGLGDRGGRKSFDFALIAILAVLVLIGLLTVYSATIDEAGKHFQKQVIFVVVGAVSMVGLYFVPTKVFYALAYPFYALSLFPLLYIIVFKANSVERWIALPGGFNLQPSELTKIAFLLAMARLLSFKPVSLARPKSFIAPAALFIVPFILVLKQPNLSTALSFVCMTLVMAYWSGLALRDIFMLVSPVLSIALTSHQWAWAAMFLVLVAVMILSRVNLRLMILLLFLNMATGYGAIFVWHKILYEHQRSRILTFVDPMRDPLGAGYQVLQSKVAIGSGRFYGKGLFNATQTNLSFLPEHHTDFIYSVLGEQFGFMGCVLVLILYFCLLYRILRLCTDVRNRFVNLVAAGVAGIFIFHIFVNIAMTMGLMPVTGLPLPFLSYGGSFMITCLMMMGLLINFRARGHNL